MKPIFCTRADRQTVNFLAATAAASAASGAATAAATAAAAAAVAITRCKHHGSVITLVSSHNVDN